MLLYTPSRREDDKVSQSHSRSRARSSEYSEYGGVLGIDTLVLYTQRGSEILTQ